MVKHNKEYLDYIDSLYELWRTGKTLTNSQKMDIIYYQYNDPFVQDIISRESSNYAVDVLADSIPTFVGNKDPESSYRLLTLYLKYPRFIHAEVMTHKRFSRNASSSRARPILKEIERINENPAIPIYWGKNQSGMQAKEEVDGSIANEALDKWCWTIGYSAGCAEYLHSIGVHKQTVNRLLEPFQLMEVVFTGNYDSFLDMLMLRLHRDAQPEFIKLSYMILEAITDSEKTKFRSTNVHLPYFEEDLNKLPLEDIKKVCVARCARVSYRCFDGSIDYIKDMDLFNKLIEVAPPHASAAEHVAIAKSGGSKYANLLGWMNYRTELGI